MACGQAWLAACARMALHRLGREMLVLIATAAHLSALCAWPYVAPTASSSITSPTAVPVAWHSVWTRAIRRLPVRPQPAPVHDNVGIAYICVYIDGTYRHTPCAWPSFEHIRTKVVDVGHGHAGLAAGAAEHLHHAGRAGGLVHPAGSLAHTLGRSGRCGHGTCGGPWHGTEVVGGRVGCLSVGSVGGWLCGWVCCVGR